MPRYHDDLSNFENRPITHQPVHVILRLHGSISPAEALRLRADYEAAQDAFTHKTRVNGQLRFATRADLEYYFQTQYDQILDRQHNGPMFLADSRAKEIILNSLLHRERQGLIDLYAASVMSNHLHLLLRNADPMGSIPFEEFFTPFKRYTGKRINGVQDQPDRRVWANRGFDRDVRPGKFWTVLQYILYNPVQAGLVNAGGRLHWCGNYVRPDLAPDRAPAGC